MTTNTNYELEAMASYLVSLFYKSKKNYSCTRSKIGKLLVLNTLCNIDNQNLLNTLYISDESIYTYEPSLLEFIYRDVYIKYPFCDDKKPFTELFDESVVIPNMFQIRLDRYELDDNSKRILEDIFRNFASYPLGDLNKMIKEIIPLIVGSTNTKVEDKNHIKENYKFFKNNRINELYKDNKIYSFLKYHILENPKNKYDLEDITNYIIHLYDKIEGIYFCNHLKIQKLVLLALYDYYEKNDEVFINDVKVISDDIVGLKIDTRNTYIRTPITISNLVNNDRIDISQEELEKYRKSKIFGFDESTILDNELVKSSLIDTFIKYASYDTKVLNSILNDKINEDFFETCTGKITQLNTENISKIFKFDKNKILSKRKEEVWKV